MMAATIFFMCLTVVPTFFGRLGSIPAWLAVQGLVLGSIGLIHGTLELHTILVAFEAVLVRGLLVPWLLRRIVRRSDAQHQELLPSNLFTWGVGIALIALAAQFGAIEGGSSHALVVGAVGIAVLLGLLMLATTQSRHVQFVALLFVENAIALYETQLPEPWPLPIHVGLSVVYLMTVVLAAWLVGTAPASNAMDTSRAKA